MGLDHLPGKNNHPQGKKYCHEVKLISGKVFMKTEDGLEEGGWERNMILSCVSVPQTDLITKPDPCLDPRSFCDDPGYTRNSLDLIHAGFLERIPRRFKIR
jgi:hypothetical protein